MPCNPYRCFQSKEKKIASMEKPAKEEGGIYNRTLIIRCHEQRTTQKGTASRPRRRDLATSPPQVGTSTVVKSRDYRAVYQSSELVQESHARDTDTDLSVTPVTQVLSQT